MIKRLNFDTAEDTRRSLSKLANAVLSGEIDESKAKSITYIAQTVLSSIRTDEQSKLLASQEKKLSELEEELKSYE